jgi:DMSO reductase anchor subunit
MDESTAEAEPFRPAERRREPRIGLRTEWSLLGFTLAAALAVGWAGAAALTGRNPKPALLVPLGLAATGLSTLHLGRPLRAWRALLNPRRSWLSREVLLFPLFLALVAAIPFAGAAAGTLGRVASVVGFAALFAMDRVYSVTRTTGLAAHSAQVLLTGALFLGLLASQGTLVLTVMALKIALYAIRKVRLFRASRPWRPGWSLARICLALPVLAWVAPGASPALQTLALLALVAGECIDRGEYYVELEPPTPAAQMAKDEEEWRRR